MLAFYCEKKRTLVLAHVLSPFSGGVAALGSLFSDSFPMPSSSVLFSML